MRNLTKIAATKKIRQHLEKRGEEDNFVVTPTLVLYWWHYINNAMFGNKLTIPKKIICKRFHSVDGWCLPMSKKGMVHIGINSEMYDRKQFLETLAHEMVHQWEWTYVGWPTHGKSFMDWKKPLMETLGIELQK